jgi:hypothetical protein
MSTSEKGIGIAAIIMAVCCAVLPLAGGALAGGLAFGAGTISIVAGVLVFGAVEGPRLRGSPPWMRWKSSSPTARGRPCASVTYS